MKFKITIKRLLEEEHEMILENESITGALDTARLLTDSRNKKNNNQYYVSKIEEEEK